MRKIKTLKGRVFIETPDNFFKGAEIDIPIDKPSKEVELTGEQKEGKIKVKVSYLSIRGENLNCLVEPEGKRNGSMIGFWFLKIPKPGQVFRRRGQNFSTGRFIHWVCYFERTH